LLASKIMLGWVLAGLLALGSLVAWGWRRQRQRARLGQLEPQLVAALRLMSSSLECGLSAVQALDRMQAESPSPIAEEFAQVTRALELGTPLHLALEEVAMRVGSASFASFAMIVSVQHRIGGDMAALLSTLADNIQERLEFNAQLNALTAQARYSAWVLTALPFGVCGLVALANPGYISPLIMTTTGRVMLGFAALLLLIGLLAVRTISRVDL